MPGFALAQGFFSGAHGVVTGKQVQVLLRRGVDPGFGIVGRWRQHGQGMNDAFDGVVVAVGQGHQRLERIVYPTLGGDSVGARCVVTGLGLQHVGLVRQANVKALVGLIQLTLERGFFGLGRGQRVLGAQDLEVVLRALQNEVLFGRGKLQRRLLVDGLGGLQLEPAIRAEDGLAQCCLVGRAAAGSGH